MIKWTDIHEWAEAVVRRLLGGLADEVSERGAGTLAREMRAGSTEEVEEGIVERLRDSGRLYERMALCERYDYKKAYGKLKAMERRRRNLRRLGVWSGVAACFAAVGLFALSEWEQEEPRVAQRFEPVREVKAILVRADGERYRLDAKEQRLKDGDGVSLSTDSTGLRYEAKEGKTAVDSAAGNSLLVPRGGVYNLTLADGTRVWLNSDSRLDYPESFSGKSREVVLRGEAYFDVRSDSLRPFIVRTDLGAVTVLGTELNVKCYPEEASVAATLVEGSVSFSNERTGTTRLKPGCQLVFDKGAREVSVRGVNVRYFVGWKDNVLMFQNERLADIMRVLSRWYDVTVVFESEKLKDLVFSGNLDKYDSIEAFFKLFELSSSVRFSMQGNYVYVGEKRE